MAKLKTVVSRIIDRPEQFDYDSFEENTGINKNDNVSIEDAVLAFHEAQESADLCLTRANQSELDNQDNPDVIIWGIALIVGFSLYRKMNQL